MLKKITSLVIITGIFVLIGLFIFRKYSSCIINKETSSGYSIAVVLPVTHPALQEIVNGFVDTMKKYDLHCAYDFYNANGDRILLRNQIEKLVTKKYDLIFTVATSPALIAKEVCQQRGVQIPIVAGAVDDPVGIGLVASMESSKNNITSVTGIDNFDQEIALIQLLKPEMKSMMLVYAPTTGLDKDCQNIKNICLNRGIALQVLHIFNMNDLMQKPAMFIANVDVVMILKDNMVVSGVESLVTLCNRMGKTLYASDLNSGDKGAVLSYGVYEYQDGVESAHKAFEILKNGKHPSQVPSSATKDFKLKLNKKYMKDQNCNIDPLLMFLMQSGEVV